MSFPLNNCQLVGAQQLNITDLALPTALASGDSKDSTTWTTGNPASVYVLGVLASGQATIKLKVGSTSTIDRSSGTTDFAVPPAGRTFASINTSTSNPYVGIRLTDANWSCAFSSLGVFTMYALTAGEGGSIHSGLNAVGSTLIGDGSGVVSIVVGQ